MKSLFSFLLLAKGEALKITWPSREQVVRYTLIVLSVSAAVAVLLGTLDSFFGMLFKKIILGE
ncbi:MAG: preprotein translocase subunit SecE [Candidatus Moraniibacteriota bacterium]|nr:MAG: preprotein translocase subunit SecE [Candidatus Moranbacteria bacterium]